MSTPTIDPEVQAILAGGPALSVQVLDLGLSSLSPQDVLRGKEAYWTSPASDTAVVFQTFVLIHQLREALLRIDTLETEVQLLQGDPPAVDLEGM